MDKELPEVTQETPEILATRALDEKIAALSKIQEKLGSGTTLSELTEPEKALLKSVTHPGPVELEDNIAILPHPNLDLEKLGVNPS